MSSAVIAKGHKVLAGAKLNANPWGDRAVTAGSGDGVEIDGHGLKPNVTLIQNDALGSAQRRPGVKGDELYAGDIGPAPLYYRGLELLLALAHGQNAVTALGSGAHKHVMKLSSDHAGRYITFVADMFGSALAPVWEYPFVKIAGFRIEVEHNQMAKVTFPAIPMSLNFNTGPGDADQVVAAVTPANGALTIADGTPDNPTPLSVLVVDANTSITELILTIVGTDRDNNVISEVYTLSDHGLTYTTRQYFKTVVSATVTGLAGTATGDTIQVGVTNGANNSGTVSGISLPTDRNFVVFSQLESLLINPQSGGALVPGTFDDDNDEFMVSRVAVEVGLGMNEGDVTSRHRYHTEEPVTAGNEFMTTRLMFNFSKYDSRNHEQLKYLISKEPQKAKLTFQGPVIGGGFPYSLTFYFNNLQVVDDAPVPSGPGIIPFDVTAEASLAVALATGFPSGYLDAITTELVTTLATNPLA